jgi:glutathione S-transferase
MLKLSLYHYPSCFYCRRVRKALETTGIQVELRNIHEDYRWRRELLEARGRATVPVLRIEDEQGELQWMPESRDIIRFLNTLQDSGDKQQTG